MQFFNTNQIKNPLSRCLFKFNLFYVAAFAKCFSTAFVRGTPHAGEALTFVDCNKSKQKCAFLLPATPSDVLPSAQHKF